MSFVYHATLNNVLSWLVSCHVMSCVTPRHVTSRHVTSHHITPYHIIYHITSHHITSHHIIYIISYYIKVTEMLFSIYNCSWRYMNDLIYSYYFTTLVTRRWQKLPPRWVTRPCSYKNKAFGMCSNGYTQFSSSNDVWRYDSPCGLVAMSPFSYLSRCAMHFMPFTYTHA